MLMLRVDSPPPPPHTHTSPPCPGKELVQNLLMLRFSNSIMGAWW